ncbi:hypothetical protein [Candidatus Nanosyncoccus alces]|uniref:Uncharacterized protein n=1 Tax=Candidatus Nanosyncoccus alces TaxID=2171997 RepID=A0ABY0FM51_9BACT|nr:hypothetical protein [Candidatus Nanosyncoccus alces]RYC74959.1 hypothetical protein G3RUM_00236 [Candidatus Nanosyncoccus alces]
MAQKRKKNKKKLYWIVTLVLFVTAGVVAYLVWDNYFKDKSEKKEDTIEIVEGKKENDDEGKGSSNAEDEEVIEKEKIVLYEGDDPNEKEGLTGVVTYAGVSGEYLMIRVNIDQYLDGGSCELNLEQNGVAYSEVVSIAGGATTATCEGFNVPVSRLGVGSYQIKIKISSGERTGTINGEVNV